MGAPAPELVDRWLARAFNRHDVEAASAMYQYGTRTDVIDTREGTIAPP